MIIGICDLPQTSMPCAVSHFKWRAVPLKRQRRSVGDVGSTVLYLCLASLWHVVVCGSRCVVVLQMAVTEARAALVEVKAADLAQASLGESEAELRRAFDKAYTVPCHQTSVIFIDEIDTICPHRSHASVHEARLVAQLLTLLDGSHAARSTVRCASACHIILDGVWLTPGRG